MGRRHLAQTPSLLQLWKRFLCGVLLLFGLFSFHNHLAQVKLREMTILDLQKKIAESDARLKQQQHLYEAVRPGLTTRQDGVLS